MTRQPLLGLRVNWLQILPLAACLLVAADTSHAQDPEWLRSHSFPDPKRVEGLLEEPNALREYDVLSFLAFHGDPTGNHFAAVPANLRIQYCQAPANPPAAHPMPAFIEVRQLAGHVNYLMKTSQPPAAGPAPAERSFVWPTRDVIQKNNINPNQLGVVIHLGEDNEYASNLAPAVFSPADPSQPALSAERIDHYTLTLHIQQNTLDSLAYQIRPAQGKPIPCYYQNDLHSCRSSAPNPPAAIEAGSLVRLGIDLSQVAPGPVAIHIEGKYRDQDGALTANFHFNHEPQCQP